MDIDFNLCFETVKTFYNSTKLYSNLKCRLPHKEIAIRIFIKDVVKSAMQTRMPAVYIAKYNRFVDNIIGRINKILSSSYDPVRVKLQTPETKKNNKSNTKNKSNKKKSNKKKSNAKTSNKSSHLRVPDERNKMGDFSIARATESEAREPAFVLVSKNSDNDIVKSARNNTVTIRKNVKSKTKNNSNKKNNKNKKKKNNKGNTKSAKKTQKARATLYGLSSIRRDGDVSVNMMTNHTTVKTDFILGPLTLRVEKEFGRGANRELKSATATTTEMHGRLNLRIVHGGAATLHTIRVLQPKEVRVESKDNHDKTREYVWKRSSHIAHVVSSKLAKAARSMLKPPPSI